MDKMNYRLFPRKYLLGCLGYPHSFLVLSVSFSHGVVFPARLCSKPFQHIDIVGLLARLDFEEHIKQVSHLTELLLLFHETTQREKNHQNTKDFVDNNYLAYYTVSPYH